MIVSYVVAYMVFDFIASVFAFHNFDVVVVCSDLTECFIILFSKNN